MNSLGGWFLVKLSKISKIALYVEEGYVTDDLKNKQSGDSLLLLLYHGFCILTFTLEDRLQNIVGE